jgi:hypothetical protein
MRVNPEDGCKVHIRALQPEETSGSLAGRVSHAGMELVLWRQRAIARDHFFETCCVHDAKSALKQGSAAALVPRLLSNHDQRKS